MPPGALVDPKHLDILGFVAGLLTTAAFVPQVVQVVRSRSARDVSLATFVLMSIGVSLWLAYGLFMGALPVILANAVTLVLVASIVVCKLRFK